MARLTKRDEELLSTARSRLRMAIDAWSDTREDELQDLKFYAGSPANQWQWPADVLQTRGAVQGQTINARPCITINRLPQHVKTITNDMRQNRPSGKVIPVDDAADPDVAEILDGVVRHVEYASDADVAYDTAAENAVIFGEGFIRILTEYCDDDTFDQDIRIVRVRSSFAVYLDPLIQDPCGADAQWAFITEEVTRDEYERKWPNAAPVSTLQSLGVGDQSVTQWIGERTVRIAEYFWIETEEQKLNLYPGGATAIDGSPQDMEWRGIGLLPTKSRKIERKRVKWGKTNGYEWLDEPRDWLGQYIPIVRVVGNEFEVEGRVYLSGLVRNAMDAQRMNNYWVSQEAEMLALAPKAPFIGYGGQFEGYEQQWKTANVVNYPYLEVNSDATDAAGSPLPLPQRAMPPMAQQGLIEAKLGAIEDIKATTGQYNASLGQLSNEKSGKAILARERQADTGTYHYVDNLARAVRYVTRQIVDLIPRVYDAPRIARIIGEDGEAKTVRVDPYQREPVRENKNEQGAVIEKIYNFGVGRYDVRVTTGPSYMTKRQESLEAMAQLLQGNPQLWAVAGDLFVRSMDWPGAEELAERLQKTIDPKLLSDSDDDPALQAAKTQIEQMGQQMQAMQAMLQNVQQSMEAQELEIKRYDAETKRISAVQAGMSPEQIQEIVLGTLHAAIETGDIVGQVPDRMPAKYGDEAMPQDGEVLQ